MDAHTLRARTGAMLVQERLPPAETATTTISATSGILGVAIAPGVELNISDSAEPLLTFGTKGPTELNPASVPTQVPTTSVLRGQIESFVRQQAEKALKKLFSGSGEHVLGSRPQPREHAGLPAVRIPLLRSSRLALGSQIPSHLRPMAK